VLDPARAAGDQPPEDLRLRYGLAEPLTPAAVTAQVKQVRQCWRRARGQLKYRKIIDRLEAEHRELAPVFAAAERGDLKPLRERLRGGDERTTRRQADARARLLDAAGAVRMLTPSDLDGLARSSGIGGPQLTALAHREGVEIREPDALPATPPYPGYPKARESLDVLGHRHVADFLFGRTGPIRVLDGFHGPGLRLDQDAVRAVAAEWARRPRDTSSTNADTVLIGLKTVDLNDLILYDVVARIRERHRERASPPALLAFAVEVLGVAVGDARRLVFAIGREGGPGGGAVARLRELLDTGEVQAAAELAATLTDPDEETAVLAAEARQRITTAARLRDEASAARDPDAAWALLSDALHLVPDLPGAEELRRRLPPCAVPSVTAAPEGTTVLLSWAPTPSASGEIVYEVVRWRSGGPAEVITTTPGTVVRDAAPPINVALVYGIVAHRGEASAAPTRADPVVVRPEPSGVEVTAGDGAVTGRWALPAEAARAQVSRDDTAVPADRLGFTDRDVRNGTTHRYRVAAVYLSPDGREVETPGVRLAATPSAPPEPVTEFTVEPDGTDSGRLLVFFDFPRHGTAELVLLPGPPPWSYGTLVPAAEVRATGRPLQATPTARGMVVRPRGAGVLLAVTIGGNVAAIGAHRKHVSLPAPTALSVTRRGAEVHVGFSWPADLAEVEVSYQAGPGQPRLLRVSRASYEAQGGLRLAVPAGEPLELSVAASSQASVGVPVRAVLGARAPVRYEVDRGGPPWNRLIVVTVSADRPVRVGELVLVVRGGNVMPQQVSDGEVLARWAELDLTGPVELSVPRPHRAGPYWLRCFTSDDGIDLADPPVRRLKVT
jgi:hypothetical protein